MSRTVKELVEAVLTEGNFDATESQVLSWLNTRHELMCARTKCYRRKIQIGPTVAEQNGYPLPPEVMEIREVQVQSSTTTPPGLGVPYGAGRHIDLAEGALHYIWLGGPYPDGSGPRDHGVRDMPSRTLVAHRAGDGRRKRRDLPIRLDIAGADGNGEGDVYRYGCAAGGRGHRSGRAERGL